MENSFVVIGDEDWVSGFKMLRFRVYSLRGAEEFKTILEEVLRDKTAVCLVQDDIYSSAQEQINNYRSLPLPIFIPFSKTGQTDLLDGIIKEIRLKATGTF